MYPLPPGFRPPYNKTKDLGVAEQGSKPRKFAETKGVSAKTRNQSTCGIPVSKIEICRLTAARLPRTGKTKERTRLSSPSISIIAVSAGESLTDANLYSLYFEGVARNV